MVIRAPASRGNDFGAPPSMEQTPAPALNATFALRVRQTLRACTEAKREANAGIDPPSLSETSPPWRHKGNSLNLRDSSWSRLNLPG